MDFSLDNIAFPVNYCTTRNGGVSSGAYESLNFGLFTGDDEKKVKENFVFYRKKREFPMPIIMGKQVHGTEIISVRREGRDIIANKGNQTESGNASEDFLWFDIEGDALYTEEKGLPLGVYTADCLPVLISDLQKSFVMAIHCGWRGTVDGILENSLELLKKKGKNDLTVILGPAIGSCCFEMGAEHLHRFSENVVIQRNETYYIDLKKEVRERLENSSPEINRVESIDYCTCCNPELFYSYRRDSVTGRHLNLALLP